MPVTAAIVSTAATLSSMSESSKRGKRAADAADRQADLAEEQWEYYKENYQPLETELISEAQKGVDPNLEASKASADVIQSFDKAREMEGRELGRYGINPNSGRFVGSNRASTINQSVADAGAQTKGRRYAKEATFARRLDVANMGKGIPSQVSASLYRSGAQNQNLAGMYGNDAAAGARSLGRMYSTYQQNQNNNPDLLGPDVYQNYDLPDYSDEDIYTDDWGGDNYAHGGLVSGPGTETSDSIPANISDGEFVMNADTVKHFGLDKLEKMNTVGLSKRAETYGFGIGG